jgi:tRNA (guanine9-N1)-methyltransferase
MLSKNERRRRERRERKHQLKLEKKERVKQSKIQHSASQGRDWHAEYDAQQQYVNERTQHGDRQHRLNSIWKAKLEMAQSTFQICIDGSFESSSTIAADTTTATTTTTSIMSDREIASLAQQIRYCYAYNKKNIPCPHLVAVTGLKGGQLEEEEEEHDDDSSGTTGNYKKVVPCLLLDLLKKEVGYEKWEHRGFVCTTQQLEEYYYDDSCCCEQHELNDDEKDEMNVDNSTVRATADDDGGSSTSTNQRSQSNMVYLTSDASDTLHVLDDTAIYIIGGIVDRNRCKRAAINRADRIGSGLKTAKLPLDEFYQSYPQYKGSTKVLAVNHVFDILLRVHRYSSGRGGQGEGDGGQVDSSWHRAFKEVLPIRKQQQKQKASNQQQQ